MSFHHVKWCFFLIPAFRESSPFSFSSGPQWKIGDVVPSRLVSLCTAVLIFCEKTVKRRREGLEGCVEKDGGGGQGVCLPSRFRDPVGEQ